MRTLPIAAAALALLSTAASAQMTTTTPRPASPPPSATQAPINRALAVNPLAQEDVSRLEGSGVYGVDSDKIGHISAVLMDPQSKKIDRLVVAAGGVLGVGSHRVALPIDRFTWDRGKGAFRIDSTIADLKAMPEWTSDQTMTGSSTPTAKIPPKDAGDSTTTR